MIPKPTEDSITNLMARELKKYGVKVETFPIISTPNGNRKPDLWCVNAGAYPIEAKFKERDLIGAISKVQNDYIKWYDVLGIKGGFALLYPDKLAKPLPLEVVADLAHELKFKAIAIFPPKDKRKNFTAYEGTLPEIAKTIAENILTPPVYVEPSIDYIIRALRDSATYITAALKYLSGKELEILFGGKEVFKNILQYEEQKYPAESLRLASAYLLINQLLFYHVLSKRMPNKFPEIDVENIRQPTDLNSYFKNVLKVNYRSIFSYDVASRIPSKFIDQVKTVINVIEGLGPEKIGGDLLGTIFHNLIPYEVRKKVAAFYTNVMAAELLAWLSINRYDVKVADFAVGSGGLLVAAYRRKRYLLDKERKFTAEDHKSFVEEELLGVDVMPFAANVAACHLALQSPEYFTNKVNIAIWDSTELEPGKTIPSIASLKYVLKGQKTLEIYFKPGEKAKGVVSLTGETPKEISLEKYDVVIMNPPFTRHERIPENYKTVLFDRFRDYSDYLHGQMSYSSYFILLADRFLKKDGRMALVLPATVLHRRSTEGLRKLWSQKYHVEYIITAWHRLAFSESTAFKEILLVAKKTKPPKNAVTKICVLKKLPDKISKVQEIAEKIKYLENNYEDNEISVKILPYSKLTADITDWYRFISLNNLKLMELLNDLLSSKELIPLSQIITETERSDLEHFKFKEFHGFILKDVKRFQRKSDHWILEKKKENSIIIKHKELNHIIEVPLSCLTKALRRFSYVDTIDITENSDYLIQGWFDKLPEMARYVLFSKELKALNPGVINLWKNKFEKRKAHLLLARRLYLSSPGTCLIAFYSENPTIGVDLWSLKGLNKEDAKILALWLNSSVNILQLLYIGVASEGPWMKLHDYMFDRLLVPNLKTLSGKERKELLKTFNMIARIPFKSIKEQLKNGDQKRKRIDEAWLKVLGYEGNTEAFLVQLYKDTLNELKIIEQLKPTSK